jgi:hypothetical protein
MVSVVSFCVAWPHHWGLWWGRTSWLRWCSKIRWLTLWQLGTRDRKGPWEKVFFPCTLDQAPLPKFPTASQNSWGPCFQHKSLWRTFHIQTISDHHIQVSPVVPGMPLMEKQSTANHRCLIAMSLQSPSIEVCFPWPWNRPVILWSVPQLGYFFLLLVIFRLAVFGRYNSIQCSAVFFPLHPRRWCMVSVGPITAGVYFYH